MDISDSTGTFDSCKFLQAGINSFLAPVETFMTMSTEARTALKYKVFMKPAKIFVAGSSEKQGSVVVLHCQIIGTQEMAEQSPTPTNL